MKFEMPDTSSVAQFESSAKRDLVRRWPYPIVDARSDLSVS